MKISPLAGKAASLIPPINIPQLITAYYALIPDVSNKLQSVSFGTSGHRGTSLHKTFNEQHILALSQAICLYRQQQGIDGPLFLGFDTHALSYPAYCTALEVLIANKVNVKVAVDDEFTPTPVISHAILTYNTGKKTGLADGIVITPSHNPPQDCGFKYNPTNGGPADQGVTSWIQTKANEILASNLNGVVRATYEKALNASNLYRHDFKNTYIDDLKNIIEFDVIAKSNIRFGVDPLGGAGTHYWKIIAERYKLNLDIVSEEIDPTFRFMTLDSDGQIRMDPSSTYAMQRLIGLKDLYTVACACDTDYDRHGIVTKSAGLLPPNHYLSVAADYLLRHRPQWSKTGMLGKTVVTTRLIDRIAAAHQRSLYEVPVGFKWFVDKLYDGSLGFCGEESAGATFLRLNGDVWTTDKDGFILSLLAFEMTSRLGKDPGELYRTLTETYGAPYFGRIEAPLTPKQKELLKKLKPEQIHSNTVAGEKITNILTTAPGNGAPIDGVKVETQSGWFAARPSGTEDIYRIYAESFKDNKHLASLLEEAQRVVDEALI